MHHSKRFILSFVAGAIAVATLALPQVATASLIYDPTIIVDVKGQGFGNVPRDLTIQAKGNGTTESGAVGVDANGEITFGSPIATSFVHDSNGVTNASGNADLVNPLKDDQKYGIPTTGSLGITSANQIGILFNAVESSGNGVNVTDLTLKFYGVNGNLLGAIDGQQNFAGTETGNGSAGYVFIVDTAEESFVNGLLALGGASTRLALESSITNVSGGPESYAIFNKNKGVVPPSGNAPEPGTIAIFGLGLLGMGFVSLRGKKKQS